MQRSGWLRMALVSGLAAITACAEQAPAPPPASNTSAAAAGGGGAVGEGGLGGSGTGGGGGAAGGADVCAGHSLGSEAIEEIAVAEDPPAALGGPIVSGTYQLVAVRSYVGASGEAGPTGRIFRETQVWSPVDLQTALDYGDGAGERHLELAYDLGDGFGTLATTVLCHSDESTGAGGGSQQLSVPWKGYTSDHGQLILFATAKPIAWEYALER